MSDFPASKLQRGKIFATTGLKVGTNYVKYYLKQSLSGKRDASDKDRLHMENAQQVFAELTRLRGTALKLAQAMSFDTGLLPDQFIEVMAGAQYSVPPMNRALVRAAIKRELGSYPEQSFKRFSPDAVAAASIGQVHQATLKDGRQAAVKVQYPNIRETIDSDLAIAKSIFRRIVSGEQIDYYFKEIREKLLEETDYVNEGRQLEAFAGMHRNEQIVTPELVSELTSQRVLTMTYLEGNHLEPFLRTSPDQQLRNHFGQILWDFFHQQIAGRHYTIHADIHPGNFLFREDGRLGIIDFGCMKTFPEPFLNSFLQMIPAHLSGDDQQIKDLYYRTEILETNPADPDLQETYFRFFKSFGMTVLAPYAEEQFDFGDPDFREALNLHYKQASTFSEVRGSRHFVFLNKVVIGLFSLLMQLKPVIETQSSKKILEAAIVELAD